MKITKNTFIFIIILVFISGCSEKQELNPDSISYCKKFNNGDVQQKCLIAYAKKVNSINEDEAINACKSTDDSLSKDICLFEVFRESTPFNPNFCIEIDNLQLQFKCLRIMERPHLEELID